MADASVTRVVARAAGGPEMLEIEQVPATAPGKGEIVVRMEAAGVAFSDVQIRQGRFPIKLPAVPGFDMVGRIAAFGPEVTGLALGQRVAAVTMSGGYATEAVAQAKWAVPVPDGLDAAEVTALVLSYLTAWRMLHRAAKVPRGGSILVLGAAGGVGSALTELAALEGIRVYGTASAHRRATLEARGVTVVADQSAVPELVDATFDSVGGPSLTASRRATKRSGVVAAYGMSFAIEADLSKISGLTRAVLALAKGKLLPGAKLVNFSFLAPKNDPAALRADLAHLIDLLARGELHPVVATLPLAEAAEAHRRLEAREVVGKLVLVP